MDFVNKAIGSVTPASTTEEKAKVEAPKETTTTTTPAGRGIVEQAKDTADVVVGKVAGATAYVIGATMDESEAARKYAFQAETFLRGYETPDQKDQGVLGGGVANTGSLYLRKYGTPEQKDQGALGGGVANTGSLFLRKYGTPEQKKEEGD